MPPRKPDKSVPLWTPPKKLPERVRNIAFSLFMERWKCSLAKGNGYTSPADVKESYKDCIQLAQAIVETEGEPTNG